MRRVKTGYGRMWECSAVVREGCVWGEVAGSSHTDRVATWLYAKNVVTRNGFAGVGLWKLLQRMRATTNNGFSTRTWKYDYIIWPHLKTVYYVGVVSSDTLRPRDFFEFQSALSAKPRRPDPGRGSSEHAARMTRRPATGYAGELQSRDWLT
jgi:hypothetical protein